MELRGTAIKALKLTAETALFVDRTQVSERVLDQLWAELPKGLLIVGVLGEPNVEAYTRAQLQEILDRKP